MLEGVVSSPYSNGLTVSATLAIKLNTPKAHGMFCGRGDQGVIVELYLIL